MEEKEVRALVELSHQQLLGRVIAMEYVVKALITGEPDLIQRTVHALNELHAYANAESVPDAHLEAILAARKAILPL